MSVRIDAKSTNELQKELERVGSPNVAKCFNCGNCTAVCALSKGGTLFPRRYVRYVQLGLRDRIVRMLEPWLCYYCGECSETCPRQMEPGELTMSLRRWLTTQYDWTGLSRLMYQSKFAQVAILVLVSLTVLLLFMIPGNFGFRLLAQHPESLTNVNLQHFAPTGVVHIADLILAALLAFFLVTNAGRMLYLVMHGLNVRLGTYFTEFKQLFVHGFTQRSWYDCHSETSVMWVRHLALVTGYGTMFLLVVFFLPWFQVENTAFHWTSILGYYGTLTLLAISAWMIRDRMGKVNECCKHSCVSDWLFPSLLFFTALTGIFLHVFRLMNLAMPTYVLYLIHLMIAVPMLVVEVPFGKWAHMLYRPMAAYLAAVQAKARELEKRKNGRLPEPRPSIQIGAGAG